MSSVDETPLLNYCELAVLFLVSYFNYIVLQFENVMWNYIMKTLMENVKKKTNETTKHCQITRTIGIMGNTKVIMVQ